MHKQQVQDNILTTIQDVMARASTDPWKYLKQIEFNGNEKGELERMEYPNYPDNCWTLDVEKQTNQTSTPPQ